MKRGRSKAKGAGFERYVCTSLSLWISNGRRSDIFWRSAMSGGRSTVAFRKGETHKAQAGDISAVSSAGNRFIDEYFVECKNYKNLDFHGVIKGNGNLLVFWSRAKVEAKRYGKIPILIAKQNSLPIILCTTRIGARKLEIGAAKTRIYIHRFDLVIVHFDEFVQTENEYQMKKRV